MTDEPRPPSIAANLILKDSEDSVRTALDSIVDIVDEIVVVMDARSTDDTARICAEEYDAKVLVREWTGFSDQRNHAIENTEAPWILVIDGDEEFTEFGNIRAAIEHADDENKIDGLLVTVVSGPKDGAATEKDMQTRVFRNREDIRYRYPIHNQLRGLRAFIPTGASLNAYYEGSMDGRHERNVEALSPMLESEHPEEVRHALYFLTRSYAMMQDWPNCRVYGDRLWDAAAENIGFVAGAVSNIHAVLNTSGAGVALRYVEKSLAVHPGVADLWWLRSFLSLHRFGECVLNPGQYMTVPQFSKRFLEPICKYGPTFGMRFNVDKVEKKEAAA